MLSGEVVAAGILGGRDEIWLRGSWVCVGRGGLVYGRSGIGLRRGFGVAAANEPRISILGGFY